MTGERVAMICFDNPFLMPLEGGKRSMATRIRALEMLDIHLDIYLLNKRSEGMLDVSNVSLRQGISLHQYRMRRSNPLMALSAYPIAASKRTVRQLTQDINRRRYDVIIFEGEHVALYRMCKGVSARRNILYYHDIESRYRSELARSTARQPHRLFQTLESRKFNNLEDRLGRMFDGHMFISSSELEEMRSRLDLGDTAYYAPYAVDGIVARVASASAKRLLYVGDLTVENNYRSIDWFIKAVLPQIRDADDDLRLRLVGRIHPARRDALEALDPRVETMGYVDSIDAEYEQATCVIAPVLYGAGVKIKLLDALARGQIVIANSKACEGTRVEPGRHLLVADDAAEMAMLCQSVVGHRELYLSLAEEGLRYIKECHSVEAHATVLRKVIEGSL